ncbi:MAG: hypothetical protein AB7K24_14665 [Gemmataceae bacterium]
MGITSAFVLTVMFIDCLFFLFHHQSAAAWERNPVALFLLGFGPIVPVLFRASTTCFAVWMISWARPIWQLAANSVLVGVHVYLACVYLLILY